MTANGDESMLSLGCGINWNINKWIEIIPETNIGLASAETNYTLTLRQNINRKAYIDSYLSNAAGNRDMGQMLRNKYNLGMNIGYRF